MKIMYTYKVILYEIELLGGLTTSTSITFNIYLKNYNLLLDTKFLADIQDKVIQVSHETYQGVQCSTSNLRRIGHNSSRSISSCRSCNYCSPFHHNGRSYCSDGDYNEHPTCYVVFFLIQHIGYKYKTPIPIL